MSAHRRIHCGVLLAVVGASALGCGSGNGPTAPSAASQSLGTWAGTILTGERTTSLQMTMTEGPPSIAAASSSGVREISGTYFLSGAIGEAAGELRGARFADALSLTLSLQPRACVGPALVTLALNVTGGTVSGDARFVNCGDEGTGSVELVRR